MNNRVYTFDGVRNFRDFGGYSGADGRMIKSGVLFRSAQFGEASAGDIERLSDLGIVIQADLRRPDERERHGHRWPADGVTVFQSDKGRLGSAPHLEFLREMTGGAEQAEQWMLDYYQSAPFREELTETYTAWFEALKTLGEGQAAVVNCAAGKDRTGILCALTHTVLGVDRDTIFEDYELTNIAANIDELLPKLQTILNQQIGKDYPVDVYRPLMGVRPQYLETAFATILEQLPSLEAYLEEVLGVTADDIEYLQDKYLV